MSDNAKPTKEEEILQMRFFSDMVKQCGETAYEHGFWESHALKTAKVLEDAGMSKSEIQGIVKDLSEAGIVGDPFIFLGLIVTEVGEAMEACRKGNWDQKDGVWEELADVVIRIFDFTCRFNTHQASLRSKADEFRDVILKKMAYNERRPYLHGKQY
jgi:NTP pyrophosphatase (non-canonical NTP hydrolase)